MVTFALYMMMGPPPVCIESPAAAARNGPDVSVLPEIPFGPIDLNDKVSLETHHSSGHGVRGLAHPSFRYKYI